jgi:hypothetical protein
VTGEQVATFAGTVFACVFFLCLTALVLAGTIWLLVRILPPRNSASGPLKLPWRKQ